MKYDFTATQTTPKLKAEASYILRQAATTYMLGNVLRKTKILLAHNEDHMREEQATDNKRSITNVPSSVELAEFCRCRVWCRRSSIPAIRLV